MAITTMDSGLGEALASYQPTSISNELWDRFRADAIGLVVQLHNPSTHAATKRLSRLVVFLADVAPARPEASLADLLTREQIDGFLQRAAASGTSAGTVENYRAALNALLAVREGRVHRQPARRKHEPHLEPYTEAELIRWLAAAATAPSVAAGAFARLVGCVLAGVELPVAGEELEVEVAAGSIEVCGLVWTAPVGLALPASGGLSEAEVAAGRRWAHRALQLRVDVRRLNLTALTMLAGSHPAVALLARPGLGRDRLTAVMRAAARPDAAATKAWLRGE